MADQDWSIMIVSEGGSVEFQPDVPGSKPGQPLLAQSSDLISWNNRTAQDHWPWAIDPSTGEPFITVQAAQQANLYLCDPVQAWQSSMPAFLVTVTPGTIDYVCRFHANETGQIVVSGS